MAKSTRVERSGQPAIADAASAANQAKKVAKDSPPKAVAGRAGHSRLPETELIALLS